MDKAIYLTLWAGMYILCCVLGFLPAQQGFSYYVMLVTSIVFFLPPFFLLYKAKKQQDTKTLKILRKISLLSLGLTTVFLVANFLSVLSASEALGTVLHVILSLVSVPMMCSGVALLSLFLWACLLFLSRPNRKKQ